MECVTSGDLATCTSHALGKCVVDGFMRGTFVPGRQVDFNQDVVVQVLLNEHKDGDGKCLDRDFHEKEFLLQDAEKNYWTIKLEVEKVQKRDFVEDFTREKPHYTYILSYVVGDARHAVFVEGYDDDETTNMVNCLNSWGEKDPRPEIHLYRGGNILYRVFCRTFVVFSSKGPSAASVGDCLGVYEYLQEHNNCAAYRQRHSMANTEPRYLYKYDQDWLVGPELGGRSAGTNWLYADGTGTFPKDPKLTVNTSLPSVCSVITISLHGAAAERYPEAGGEYRPTGDWSYGHPVFSNGEQYLFGSPCSWSVGSSPDSEDASLWSPRVSWCPGALVIEGDVLTEWIFSYPVGDRDEDWAWSEGDMKMTCKTHRQ